MPVTEEDVRQVYRIILNRGATAEEIASNVSRAPDLASLRKNFLLSPEFLKKHKALIDEFKGHRRPTLVQIQIPRTGSTTLAEALSYEGHLLPNAAFNHNDLANLSAMPVGGRRNLRYLRGDMPINVGEQLDMGYINLIVIRRAGPRIYSLYRDIQRNMDHPTHEDMVQNNLSFGQFLDYVLEHPALRKEVDNGQLRRLAGAYDEASFDSPEVLVRDALRNVLREGTYFGFTEYLDDLIEWLHRDRILSSREVENHNVAPEGPSLDSVLTQLTKEQSGLYKAFTEWDDYFYDLCLNVLPPSNK